MHFWVYIVRCSDGSFYTGHTDDLDKRVGEHNAGVGGDWTRRRRPVALAWCEALPSRQEAYEAERRIKPWSRAKKEGLIARDWARVSHFAKPPHERPSTSLGTSDFSHESEGANPDTTLARPERSTQRAVEGRPAP